MTEEEARAWVRDRFGVPRETLLERFGALVVAENERQNLVAASTIPELWNRHLVDSAQLVPLAEQAASSGTWFDIGSGAGFPGLVAALLCDREVVLIEPRAKRAAFLIAAAEALNLGSRVRVESRRAEQVEVADRDRATVISARAVAPLAEIFACARHLSTRSTYWLLPKGKNAQSEVAAARGAWQGAFHVEPSVSQAESWIVVARDVRRK